MNTSDLPSGTIKRLERVQKLKNYTEQEAIEFCITLGWLIAEQRSKKKHIDGMIKKKVNDGDST